MNNDIPIYTKESLIARFREIADIGFVPNARTGNSGGIGNTLEDLLGIAENNLPIPNAAEWELKTQRKKSKALVTLVHMEPSPRSLKAVPSLLLPKYGWGHTQAGLKYGIDEKSFRQTVSAASYSDRGFTIKIDNSEKKIIFHFDPSQVGVRHKTWHASGSGLLAFSPYEEPYWGFADLEHKLGSKLTNCFYVQADVKKINGEEHYHYNSVLMLKDFSFNNFLQGLAEGKVFVDFDARTGHNHGTKFRVKKDYFPQLYGTHTQVI